jgi:hypothetical protein
MPVPVGCGRPKHQEDRNGADKSAKTGHRVSQRPCLASTKTPVAKIKSPKTKPVENIDGFVSGLKAPFGAFSIFGIRLD